MGETNGQEQEAWRPTNDYRLWPADIRARFPTYDVPALEVERGRLIERAQECQTEQRKIAQEIRRLQTLKEHMMREEMECRSKAGEYDGHLRQCRERDRQLKEAGVPALGEA